MPDRIVAALASSNEHKLRELRAVLPGWRLELLAADGFPDETGETFYENALAKARFGRTLVGAGVWVLGEDSGLEVDALGGGPGLESNRWAGPGEDHVEKLLGELARVPAGRRGARYVCELVCLSPDGDELRGRGTLAGTIARTPRGSEGFGYDPVFVPKGATRTVAELGNEWKSRNSHRARAALALRGALERSGAATRQ